MDSKKFIAIGVTAVGLVTLVATVSIVAINSEEPPKTIPERVQKILSEAPVIDGHNDFPWNLRDYLYNDLSELNFTDLTSTEPWGSSIYSHTDLNRLRAGKVGGEFWVAYIPCSATTKDAVPMVLEQIDVIHRLVEKYPKDLYYATSTEDIEKAMEEGKIASLIGVEGGHMIQFSLGILRTLYALGTRYLTLTHNCNTPWADSALVDRENGTPDTPQNDGLSDFGIAIIQEMNRLGMMIDLSHVSHATQLDAINNSKAPVIFSHSNAYAIYNHHRNVRDDVLDLIKNGKDGLVMVNFYNYFLGSSGQASIQDVANHLDYLKGRVGADHIGLGGDYDGMEKPAIGLEDVSKYPDLFAVLLERGWTDEEIAKLASKNLLRVFKEVERVRDSMIGKAPREGSLTKGDLVKYNVSTTCISADFPDGKTGTQITDAGEESK